METLSEIQAEIEEAKMSQQERRAAYSLSSIYAVRMLGFFMILPVFPLFADELIGSTAFLAGIAIGIYGLNQALLQIPAGMLSDRYGRKPVIIGGLLIFAVGSLVAAFADSIYGVILGRALQGAGAIAAATLALAADLSRESQRSKIMAFIGASIGGAFLLALIIGPGLYSLIGMSGLFGLTAFLALVAIGLTIYVVPTPQVIRFHSDAQASPCQFKAVLGNSQLLRLNIGILILHMMLTANFFAVPFALRDSSALAIENHWMVYVSVLVISIVLMIPPLLIAERFRMLKMMFITAIIALAFAEFGMALTQNNVLLLSAAMVIFFAAFNFLEATLPSWITRVAPPHLKGTAMGIYSSCQFLGAFLGGIFGGLLYGNYGIHGVLLSCSIMAGIWLIIAAGMQQPKQLNHYLLKLGDAIQQAPDKIADSLAQIAGVEEAVIVKEEGVAYLKVDKAILDEDALQAAVSSNS